MTLRQRSLTIKRLKVVSKSMAFGLPDNLDFMDELGILKGEEMNDAVMGRSPGGLGRQE